MNKITFQDLPSTETPINATNLNAMQDNTETEINKIITALVNNKSTVTGENIIINDSAEAGVEEIYIRGNSVQDGTYTPDTPVEINSCGDNGSINETICNKNLFNRDSNNIILNARLGGTGEKYTGDAVATNSFISEYIVVKPSTSYSVNWNIVAYKRVALYDKNKNFISSISDGTPTFTTTENTKYIRFSELITEISTRQVEEGTITTPYVEHKSQTYTIPTQKPFRAIGDYKDTFVKQDGIWYEKHIIERIDNYNEETINTDYMSTTGELTIGAAIDYVLATPIYIQCTTEQTIKLNEIQALAKTYKNTTHIFSEDEVGPEIEVTYYKDIETMLGGA